MNRPILITVGMGVGPEICARLAHSYSGSRRLIFLGRESALPSFPYAQLSQGPRIACMRFVDEEDAAEVAAISFAAQACLEGSAAALVTGPINKKRLSMLKNCWKT